MTLAQRKKVNKMYRQQIAYLKKYGKKKFSKSDRKFIYSQQTILFNKLNRQS